MTDEKTAAEALHYVRGRLAALDVDIHALKNQRSDRRFQIAANIGIEVARIRWALSFMPEDCNYGKQDQNTTIPRLAEFAQRVLGEWPDVGDVDGMDLQEIGEATGVLVAVEMTRPCGGDCNCNEYYSPEEWPVKCYRLNLDGSVVDPARVALMDADK